VGLHGHLQARQHAEAASAAKSAFLAHMSHELRTPLNGVLGMLQVALRSPLDERQRHWLEVAQSSGRLLLTLLNDLLDLSRIEAGRLEIEHVPFDLGELMHQTLAPLKLDAEGKGLQWHVALPAPQALRGDPVRVRQVLINVVGNAVKFTREGAIAIDVAAVPVADGSLELHFRVTDTGIGIEAEQLSRLFQPFAQADSSIVRRYGGTGLGLALVRRMVELMGGRVDIESAPGQGTTVRWHLRCERA
jgi:signal transduction histidine kinase